MVAPPRSAQTAGQACRPAWEFLAPLLFFLALSACGYLAGIAGAHPAWLDEARRHALEVGSRGIGFLPHLEPAGDPRVGPAALLLLLGLPPGAVFVSFRLLGLAAGGAAVALLARRSPGRPSLGAGAWFLAASPIWQAGALGGDPLVLVGLLFLLFQERTAGRWPRIALLGWSLGWSPWAWVSVVWLPLLGSLAPGGGRRREGLADLLMALAAIWVLNPAALMDPPGWIAGMWRATEVAHIWGSGPRFGLPATFFPLAGSVHVAGAVLLVFAGRGWPRRMREQGDGAPLVFLVLLFLGLRSGFAHLAPILILLPWAAAEIGRVLAGWRPAARRRLGTWGARLAMLLLVVPLLLVAGGRWDGPRRDAAQQAAAAEWVAARLEAGSLVLHDLGFVPPEETELIWLALPFHALDPAQYRGAYWMGWYRGAAAFVASERLVARFMKERGSSGPMLAFYADMAAAAGREEVFGRDPGRRLRVLCFPQVPADPLGDAWRARVAAGVGGGLPGEFVASLGGALSAAGHPGAAIALLEECLVAGYQALGIYLNLANAQLEFGRVTAAGQVLDEGRRYHPESPELRYNLALVLTRAGLWERAVNTLARLQRQWPRSAQVAYLLGVSLANSERPAAARQQLLRALELDPGLPERSQADELLELLPSGEGGP